MVSFYASLLLGYAAISLAASLADNAAGISNPTFSLSSGKKAACISGTVPIPVTATTQNFNIDSPANQTVLTETIQELFQTASTFVKSKAASTTQIKDTFDIDITFCHPIDAAKVRNVNTIQILTHGVGADKSYWDIAPDYSYVDAAVAAGFATLSYNRLGVGASSHPDPIQVVQPAVDVEILHGLVQGIHSARMGSRHYSKIVGVGHSYGSLVQSAHDTKYPDDTAATILTGCAAGADDLPYTQLANDPAIAALSDPGRFGSLDYGYLVHDSSISMQLPFFRWPFFEQSVFDSQFKARSTYSLGQLFTLGSLFSGGAASYKGAVAVFIGVFDFPFCLGNCNLPSNMATATLKALYPNTPSSGSKTFLVPEAGHYINAHFGAKEMFAEAVTFLNNAGLE